VIFEDWIGALQYTRVIQSAQLPTPVPATEFGSQRDELERRQKLHLLLASALEPQLRVLRRKHFIQDGHSDEHFHQL